MMPNIILYYNSSSKETIELVQKIINYFEFNESDLFYETTINIPVRTFSQENISYSKSTKNNKNFHFFLIDDYFLNDEKLIKVYNSLIRDEIKIIPILLSDNGFDLVKKVNSLNLYQIKDINLKSEMLLLQMSRIILQRLRNEEKVKVFLSYARSDGIYIAEKISKYINTKLLLDTIMDITDIDIGDDFDIKIKDLIKSNLMLIICSDLYSSRFWCQKEVLISKNEFIPSVIIDAIAKEETRKFPYIGNSPCLRWDESEIRIIEIINKLFFIGIKQQIFKLMNKKDNTDKCLYLNTYPELLTIVQNREKINEIYYPEPPLPQHELCLLEKCCGNIVFNTPITSTKAKKQLNKICISISTSCDLFKFGFTDIHLKQFYIELIRYLICYNYDVLYGGDWRKAGYTEAIVSLIKAYQKKETLKEYKFVNYSYNVSLPKVSHESTKRNKYVKIKYLSDGANTTENIDVRLSKMRCNMIKDCDALIAISGSFSSNDSIMPGVLEEIFQALAQNKKIILVKGFGGITDVFCNDLEEKIINENWIKKYFNPNLKIKNSYQRQIEKTFSNICANDVIVIDANYDNSYYTDTIISVLNEL